MKKKLNEANDSWDGMLPVNINKGLIPRLDIVSLHPEEDLFRVYDITAPKTIEILGMILLSSIAEKYNPISPLSVLHDIRTAFNRAGYDFDSGGEEFKYLKGIDEGFVDFPIFARTSPLYPYQIDQTYPGYRVEDDGIESKLGYKLLLRIHVSPSTVAFDNDQVLSTKTIEGEIIPQND